MKVINTESGVVEWIGTLKEFRQKNYLDPKAPFTMISRDSVGIAAKNAAKGGAASPNEIKQQMDDYPFDEDYQRPVKFVYELEEINQIAGEQITKYYPLWKQNNLIMEGDQAKLAAMNEFIQRVRDWANGEDPDPDIIDTIVP